MSNKSKININYSLKEEAIHLICSLSCNGVIKPNNFVKEIENTYKTIICEIQHNKCSPKKAKYVYTKTENFIKKCLTNEEKNILDNLCKNEDIYKNINKYFEILKNSKNNYFKIYDTYNIFITQYGCGGAYAVAPKSNSSTGEEAIIYVRQDAKEGKLAHNIFHEMVHLAIEDSIVNKYHLKDVEKEILVDFICTLVIEDFKVQKFEQNEEAKKFRNLLETLSKEVKTNDKQNKDQKAETINTIIDKVIKKLGENMQNNLQNAEKDIQSENEKQI